jgi:FtsH-binding integral membrane protein
MDLVQPRAKNIWVAALLAFLLGPLGMLYSTISGCFVMFAVNVFAAIWGRPWMLVVSWLGCIVWAGLAARD